uniref:Shavenoid isoform B-like N-terminal domain-containing protein n=1 Tax=Branchiostoma floridae TaxID=7739 RepID=C3XRF4_BRAFL|eukprot:XP_002613263.1 hypothetical protein BRAFLDRAFT_68228 [Branchiostoma floridae]
MREKPANEKMAAVSMNPLWTSPSSLLLFSTTFLFWTIRILATALDCNYDQQFHVYREDDGDVFTNPCQYVEPNNQRHCYDNCSGMEANFVGKFTFDGGVEQCACKCRQSTHVFDVDRQVCNNTELATGYSQTQCYVTVGDALYETLEIPAGQSSVFLQPRTALRLSGNLLTQAGACQVTNELYLDRTGVWPLGYIFSYSGAGGPFFRLSARSDGYMYIKWRGPAHLSPCVDGLIIQLDISCNSSPPTCVRFKLDGSGLGPMSVTHPISVMTSPTVATQTPSPVTQTSSPPASSSNLAMIIGVAVGVVLALAVIGASIAFLFYRAGKVAGRQRSTMRTNLADRKHMRRKDSTKKKLDVSKLSHVETKEVLARNLREQIKKLPAESNPEKAWGNFRKVMYDTSERTLGHTKRKHQDWFDNNNEEITSLLKKKQEAFTQWLNDKNSTAKHDHLKHLRSKVQPASARKKSGVANPAYSSQKGANVPPPVPPRPGEEPHYYSSADPEDIYMELDGTQQRSLYRKDTSQGGAYTSLNADLRAEKDKGDASKGDPEPPAPPPVGSIPGYEGVYVEPQPEKTDPANDTDYEGYIMPESEGNGYIDLNGGSSNL